MKSIERKSFYATSSTKDELLNILLRVCGLTIDSYATINLTEVAKIEENLNWAINSLANEIDLNLRLLGYVAKDSRVEGIFFKTIEAEEKFSESLHDSASSSSLPIHINTESVITKEIDIDTRYIVNSVSVVMNMIES